MIRYDFTRRGENFGKREDAVAWPDAGLLGEGSEWWLVACIDWPRDRWLGYVGGYWKAADVIFERVAETGRDQDMLTYPYLMCRPHLSNCN